MQIVIEGPRWQMTPAYAMTGLLWLIWLWRAVSTAAMVRVRVRKPAHRLASHAGVALGVLAMAVCIALPNIFPVFGFPRPSGPHAIGTVTYHWIDASGPEVFGTDPQRMRELMVQRPWPARSQATRCCCFWRG